MLYDMHALKWDKKLLEILQIPACMLPEVRSSSEIYGNLSAFKLLLQRTDTIQNGIGIRLHLRPARLDHSHFNQDTLGHGKAQLSG